MDYSINSKFKRLFGFSLAFFVFAICFIIMAIGVYMGLYTNGFKKAWNRYLSNKMYLDAEKAATTYCQDYYNNIMEDGDYYSHYYDQYYSDDNNNFRFTYISNDSFSIPGYFHATEKKQMVSTYKFDLDIENLTIDKTFIYNSLEEVQESEEITKAKRLGLDVVITINDNKYYVNVNDKKIEKVKIELTCYVPSEYTAKDEYYATYYCMYLAYEFRYIIPVICIISLFFMLYFLYLLIKGTGHINQRESIKIRTVDRLPLEIVIGLFGFLFLLYLEFVVSSISGLFFVHNSNALYNVYYTFTIFLLTYILSFAVAEFIMTLAVRIKAGTLAQCSIIRIIISKLNNLLKRAVNAVVNIKMSIHYILVFILIDGTILWLGFFIPYNELRIILYVVLTILFINQFFLIYNVYLIDSAVNAIAEGQLDYKIDNRLVSRIFRRTSTAVNHISDGMTLALKDTLKSEHFKTELITNVSHDIKTPLTSIITYVNLLNKCNVNDEEAGEYMEILERQSEKLKKLIEDLIEASKASTGSLNVDFSVIDEYILTEQAVAEYLDRFDSKGLELVINNMSDNAEVIADSRHLWRVIDNLLNNIYKYALENTRVFIDIYTKGDKQLITFKNISKYHLNVSADELTERFVRGDKSRNTEGSGLGLSIARSLTEAMNGKLYIDIDGDLYKSTVELSKPENNTETEE